MLADFKPTERVSLQDETDEDCNSNEDIVTVQDTESDNDSDLDDNELF